MGIISIFIFTSISPIVFGLDNKILKKDEILDNLAFFYYEYYNSSKLDHYNENFQKNNQENIDLEEKTNSIKTSKNGISLTPINPPWPMFCHDTKHTGRSPYSTSHIDGLEKWRFRCNIVEGGPIIGDDDIIYFGDTHWNVYAIYPDGTLKWKYKTNGQITSTPALAADRTLYVSSWDDRLYAFNSSTGAKKWAFDSGDSIVSSPAIADDGTIYFGTMWGLGDGGKIYAVNPDGTEKWQYKTNYHITSDPAIGDDGTIYIGSGDDYLYAMNPNGTLKWRYKTGHYIKGSPSISEDGTVYIGSFDSYLYALYLNNGTMKWKYGAGTETNPSIDSDGTIYIGSVDKLHAIYPNGTKKWIFNVGSSDEHITQSCPAISADGTIYVGTKKEGGAGGNIIAINHDGKEKWRKKICQDWIRSSPCIGENGTVYIGSQYTIASGYIHAFGPVESNSPPEKPTITGEINGNVREDYEYKLNVVDPDNNPISFYIEWGDGTNSDWVPERASGEDCYYKHSWLIKGTYTIRVKARDTLGEESDWAYLKVNMPRTRTTSYQWLECLLKDFPLLERLQNIYFSRTIFNLQFL